MSKLSRLPVQGRRACAALAAATPWSAEEYARAVWALDDAGIFPAIGLENIHEVSSATGIAPSDAAALLVAAAREEEVARKKRPFDPKAPTIEQLQERAVRLDTVIEVTVPEVFRGQKMSVFYVPPPNHVPGHEKTTVCTAAQGDAVSSHPHACARLTGHTERETGREHRCACGVIW